MTARLGFDSVGEGSTLVLLHAFPLDRGMWRPQEEGLRDCCRVIAVDLPGFGASAPVPDGVDGMAQAVARLLDEIATNQKVVIGGLSMGGYVALAFARRYPERLQGLILADTRTEPDDDTGKANRDRMIAGVQANGPGTVIDAMLPRLLGSDAQQSRPDLIAFVRQLGERQSAEGLTTGLRALRDRPDARGTLAAVRVPVLVLVGRDDIVTPPTVAEGMVRTATDGLLVVLDQAGHLSNLEQPEKFNDAVRSFLAEIAGSSL
jgi:3-oxoadipate enol-lactonase